MGDDEKGVLSEEGWGQLMVCVGSGWMPGSDALDGR